MVIRKIIVLKKSGETVPVKPINFPPLDSLYLNLLENKEKLKKNLPIVSENKISQKIPSPEQSDDSGSESDSEQDKPEKKTKKEKDPVEALLGDPDSEESQASESGSETGSESEGEEDNMNDEEKEEMEKKHLIWQCKKMQKAWPERKELFEVSSHMDAKTIKDIHDYGIKEVSIDHNLNTYRNYLVWGFNIIEYVGTQMFGIDLEGFAKAQMASKDQYDRYLIELGDRNYLDWGSTLPIELRLLGFIFIQAAFFFIMKNMGNSLMGNKILHQTNPKRMRGPSMNEGQ
jgi:Family of unknown function (DUF5767)